MDPSKACIKKDAPSTLGQPDLSWDGVGKPSSSCSYFQKKLLNQKELSIHD
jgi:hypothetical protein